MYQRCRTSDSQMQQLTIPSWRRNQYDMPDISRRAVGIADDSRLTWKVWANGPLRGRTRCIQDGWEVSECLLSPPPDRLRCCRHRRGRLAGWARAAQSRGRNPALAGRRRTGAWEIEDREIEDREIRAWACGLHDRTSLMALDEIVKVRGR